jgi:hypothetical protein
MKPLKLRRWILSNVYIVKSGQLIDFGGWEWLNLRAFTDYDKAIEFSQTVIDQIKPDDFGETEDVEIETLTLEQ